MPIELNIENNVEFELGSGLTSGSSILTVKSGKETLLPPTPFKLTLVKFEAGGAVKQREIVNVTNKVGNILTISRAVEACPKDKSSTIAVSIAYDFDEGDSAFMTLTSDMINKIVDEINLIESETIPTLQPKCTLQTIDDDYEFTGAEVPNTGFSVVTTAGNILIDLDLSLFPPTNGMVEFKFCKSTNDSNTITIDVGAGKTIDGAQSYVLSNYMELVTIAIASTTFAKVISNPGKATPVDIAGQTETTSLNENDEFILNRPGIGSRKITGLNLMPRIYGGTGIDGDLNISSGTTTLNMLASENATGFIEKNYNNLTISGTANLNFGNLQTGGNIAYIKVKGDFTMSGGNISANEMGGLGGAGSPSFGNPGSRGKLMNFPIFTDYTNLGGSGDTLNNGGIGKPLYLTLKLNNLTCGAGGGEGKEGTTFNNSFGGNGGRGGGVLIIEVGGKFNFTGGTISSNGGTGLNASDGSGNFNASGGGGGGGGGSIAIIGNKLISNTGSILVNGGNGGNGAEGYNSGYDGKGGGGGGSIGSGGDGGGVNQNGINGGSNIYGTGGTGGTGGPGSFPGGGGGGGGAGFKYVFFNS